MPIEKEPGSPPRSWHSFDEQLLNLDDPTGPFFNLDDPSAFEETVKENTQPDDIIVLENETSESSVYPSYNFPLEPALFLDTPTVDRTDTDRLRYTLRLLEHTCRAHHSEFEDITNPSVRDSQLLARRRFLDGRITIREQAARPHRHEITDLEEAVGEVFASLDAVNHPFAQLITQITREVPELRPAHVKDLISQSLTVLYWPALKAALQEQIDEYKNTAKGSV